MSFAPRVSTDKLIRPVMPELDSLRGKECSRPRHGKADIGEDSEFWNALSGSFLSESISSRRLRQT